MKTHFIEAGNNFNHGKFLLCQLQADEIDTYSGLPGYTHMSIWNVGGARKFRPGMTFIVDLQTGEGAAFTLNRGAHGARHELDQHKVWVCPMFEPFLMWLAEKGADFATLPRYVHIAAEGELYGYRRAGGQ